MTTFAERVGGNIARHRRRSGFSQEELGVLASLHRTAIGQIERGERTPRADTLVKIAASLAVSPEALLEGVGWVPGSLASGQLVTEGQERRLASDGAGPSAVPVGTECRSSGTAVGPQSSAKANQEP